MERERERERVIVLHVRVWYKTESVVSQNMWETLWSNINEVYFWIAKKPQTGFIPSTF